MRKISAILLAGAAVLSLGAFALPAANRAPTIHEMTIQLPGGGTETKPVGLVHLCVADDRRTINRRVQLPGNRADVRERATLIAMHLLRELLAQ